jgi:hypothetical protein
MRVHLSHCVKLLLLPAKKNKGSTKGFATMLVFQLVSTSDTIYHELDYLGIT